MRYGIYYAYWEKTWGVDYLSYIEKVAGLGFDILEISCAGLRNLTGKEIEGLNKCRQEYGITLTGGYGPKAAEDISSSDEAVVKNGMDFWAETFPVLEKLGISLVGGGLYGCWPADYSRDINKEADLERSIKNMRILADRAEGCGITLCMESLNRHEGYLINTSKECVDYVKAVGKPNVKVMLDTYHMCLEEDSFRDAVLTAGSDLGHVHVGENNRRVPGQGQLIPWKELGEALKEIGYDGTVVMEPFVIHGGEVGRDIRIWRDLLEDSSVERLDEDARESLAFLKKMWAG